MFNYEIPADLTAFSNEELDVHMGQARDEFYLLNDTDATDDDTLNRMTDLADGIEAMHKEFASRATSRKHSYAKRMKTLRFASFRSRFAATQPE